MLKEKTKESENLLSQKQYKWRNLVFDMNGKSYLGITIWNSPEECENRMQKIISLNAEKESQGIVTAFNIVGGELLTRNYVWHMQIPILE